MPLLTGVVWLLGIMSLFNMPLNVVNIIAGVIASGVIVDYGLGITYEYRHNLHFGTVMAMTLSAASNVIGAGALLFARHPALYSTGVAMVICMIAGYLSSVLVVPSFCSLMATSRKERNVDHEAFYCTASCCFVAGCATRALPGSRAGSPGALPTRRRLSSASGAGMPESFQLLNTIVFEYTWFTFGGIGYLEINAADRFYKVACMNHMGVKLFEVSGNRDGVLSQSAIGPLADKGDIARAVGDDIMRVYFDLVPSAQARVAHKKNPARFQAAVGCGCAGVCVCRRADGSAHENLL